MSEDTLNNDTQNEANDTQNEANDNSEAKMSPEQETIKNLEGQVESMRNKMQELLSEAKTAKQKAREEAEAKERAKLERARKEGDFEKLLKSSEAEREKLAKTLADLQNGIKQEKINNHSMKIAAELADGSNAEILSEFISRRLQMTEDGLKVLDQSGNLTVSSIDDLKNEFQNDAKFKALVRGTKASGGGSQGSGDSVAPSKTITREAFDAMNANKRMDFIKQGGKVTD